MSVVTQLQQEVKEAQAVVNEEVGSIRRAKDLVKSAVLAAQQIGEEVIMKKTFINCFFLFINIKLID